MSGLPEVRHVEGEGFRAETPSGTARLDYRREGDTVTLTHTGVPREEEDRGIGGELVRTALEWARREGLTVVPRCPFAAAWIRENPGYEDLVA